MDGEKSLSNERKPMVLVFAGPNGSGKSTITSYFDVVVRYTNADEMVKSSFISNEEAAVKADELRYESIRHREDFTFETVLSSDYKIRIREPYRKYLSDGIFELRAKEGYGITCVLYFFYVDQHIILTNGFIKKTQKTPRREIERAKKYCTDYLRRKKECKK